MSFGRPTQRNGARSPQIARASCPVVRTDRGQAVLGVVVLDLHDVVADTESQPETLDGSPRLVHSVLDAEGPGAEATPVSWVGPRSAVAIGPRGGLRSLHCERRSAAEAAPMSSTTGQARWRRSTGASLASAIGMRDGPIPIGRRGPRTSGIAAIKSRAKYRPVYTSFR